MRLGDVRYLAGAMHCESGRMLEDASQFGVYLELAGEALDAAEELAEEPISHG